MFAGAVSRTANVGTVGMHGLKEPPPGHRIEVGAHNHWVVGGGAQQRARQDAHYVLAHRVARKLMVNKLAFI